MAASTQIITDLKSARDTGPNATSQANAIAAAGPIQDAKGILFLCVTKAEELRKMLLELDTVIDSGDGIQTQITDVLASLD